MDTLNLSDWLQFLGMTAVVVSLIFVGLQLKQSQAIAIAGQYQSRTDTFVDYYSALLQSDVGLQWIGQAGLTHLASYDKFPDDFRNWLLGLSPEEFASRALTAQIGLKAHDNIHYQYQAGFHSTEAWLASRSEFKNRLKDPKSLIRLAYEADFHTCWRKSFDALIQELIDEDDSAV